MNRTVLTVVLLLVGSICHANEEPAPDLTKAQMDGFWEAIEADQFHTVFQMNISSKAPSYLLQIWGEGYSRVLALKSIQEKKGRIKLVFELDGQSERFGEKGKVFAVARRVEIEGKGFDAGPEYSWFGVVASFGELEGRPAQSKRLSFVRTNRSTPIEELKLMADRGRIIGRDYIEFRRRAAKK
jgi:hypothetical protein